MDSEFCDKPGFSYFLEVPCETWDILQYHEAWRKAQHPMNKAMIITAIKRQLDWFQTNGSHDEILAAKRLLRQLKEDMKRGGCIDNFWADVASRCTLDTKRLVIKRKANELALDVTSQTLDEESQNVSQLYNLRSKKSGRLATSNFIYEERLGDDVDSDEDSEHDMLNKEFDLKSATDLPNEESWFKAAKKTIETVRNLPNGMFSPIWWRIMDLRPSGVVKEPFETRASEHLSKEHLRYIAVPLQGFHAQYKSLSENAEKLLCLLEQIGNANLEKIGRDFPVEGTRGLLTFIASLTKDDASNSARPLSLDQLLDSVQEGDRTSEIDLSTATNIDPKHPDVIYILQCLAGATKVVTSEFLSSHITERDVDVQLFLPFFDVFPNSFQIHYGEGESRASRARRESQHGREEAVGDHFDWIIASYNSKPDEQWGIEFGVAENSGPRKPESRLKAKNDFIKVAKVCRDQLAYIQNNVQRETGGALTERLLNGLKSVSVIGINVVGFTIRVNVLWLVGGNIYAISELGCCRLPHSTASLREALKTARTFLGIKNLLKKSKDIVAALLGEAHELRFRNSLEGNKTPEPQPLISDLITPKKLKTRATKD